MTQDASDVVKKNERQSNYLVRKLAFENPDDFEVIEIGKSLIDEKTLVAATMATPLGEATLDFLKSRIAWSVFNIEIGGDRRTKFPRHENHIFNTISLLQSDTDQWNSITRDRKRRTK